MGPSATTLPSAKRSDTVASKVEAVQVVRHHEDREPERALERQDEIVELGRGDGVEAGRRLVEEDDLGIERQRARQGDALGHAARKLGGKFIAIGASEAHHFELGGRDLVHEPLRDSLRYSRMGNCDVLPRGERREQGALLEQYAPSSLDRAQHSSSLDRSRSVPKHLDGAGALRQQGR